MKKIILIALFFAGLCFAGNFEKSADTSHVRWVYQQEYDYAYDEPVQPTPTVVIWKRTAPTHCINVNCKENHKLHEERRHRQQERRKIKVIRKE